jgi:Zn-dependent protease
VMTMEIFFPFFNFKGGKILRQNTERKKEKKFSYNNNSYGYIHTLVYGLLMHCRNLNSCIIMRNRMLKEILVYKKLFFSYFFLLFKKKSCFYQG